MKLTITIGLDNAAFEDAGANGIEAARILRSIADNMDGLAMERGYEAYAQDTNGNRVAYVKVSR